jgi:uncharacterized protein (DUF433 family)
MKEQAIAPPPIKPETPPLRSDDDKIIRIGNTRVTLDSVVAAFHRGETPEEIAQNYDALSLAEIYRSIGYYLSHQSEIDRYLEHRFKARTASQREVESRHNPAGIRDRLLARKAKNA